MSGETSLVEFPRVPLLLCISRPFYGHQHQVQEHSLLEGAAWVETVGFGTQDFPIRTGAGPGWDGKTQKAPLGASASSIPLSHTKLPSPRHLKF